jgi:hypothetical protein
MRAQVAALATVAILLSAATASAAGPPAPQGVLVLLPMEGEGLIPTLVEEVERALGKVGRVVQRSSLKLDDLLLALGCGNTSVACLQKIGQSLRADSLILVSARKAGSAVELTLRLFDVKTGGDSGGAKRALPADATARGELLLEATRAMLGIKATRVPSVVQEALGGLTISASVKDVEITFAGQPRGVTPLELRNLPVGSYDVEARRKGYIGWRGKAEVKADQVTRLEIEMVQARRSEEAPGFLESIRTSTWVIAGAGLAGLIIGSGFAAHFKSTQNRFDELEGITLQEIRQLQDLKSTGERDALAANICFGIGGAALLTSVVLSYLDYRRARNAAPPTTVEKRRAQWRVGPGAVRLDLRF